MFVDLTGGSEVLNEPVVHDRDPVRHGQRLALVMRHIHEGDADLALNPLQLHLHRLAQLEVERAQRLIQQQRAGVVDQRSGERHPLLLAARQLSRAPLTPPGQVHDLQHLAHPAGDLGLGDRLAAQPEGHVLEHVHVREQGIGLEHHVDVTLVRRDVGHIGAVQPDRARGRLLEPGDHPHRGGLPAPRRAQQREELSLGDRQVDAAHCDDDLATRAELLHHSGQFDRRQRPVPLPAPAGLCRLRARRGQALLGHGSGSRYRGHMPFGHLRPVSLFSPGSPPRTRILRAGELITGQRRTK